MKLAHLVGFITKKFVTILGHMKFQGMRERFFSYISNGCFSTFTVVILCLGYGQRPTQMQSSERKSDRHFVDFSEEPA